MTDEKVKEVISKSCRFCVPAYANLQEGIEAYPEDILSVQKDVLGAKMRFCVYIDGSPNSQQLYITQENPDIYIIAKKKINYCPICGRKLMTDGDAEGDG